MECTANGKIIVKQIGDMEPSCAKCGNANAMLHKIKQEPDFDMDTEYVDYIYCRDCGWEIKVQDVHFKKIN